MKFFPYENFYIQSPLKPGEVIERLSEAVSPDLGYSFGFGGRNPRGPNTPFKGDITGNKFEFEPTIIYKNAFLPQISGSIEAYDGGSLIHVKMRMHIFIMIVTGLATTISGTFSILFLPHVFSNKHTSTDIIPYLVFLVFYGMALGGFKSESITSRTYLVELFEGKMM